MGSERSQIARNQDGIRGITAGASSDLDTLARLFEDDRIEDDGTVAGRATALFEATERALIPGLQTALPFSDSGFAGNRDRGCAGFRDPWPSSRNQVGHFLTAVRLSLAPDVVHQSIPILGSIRAIVGAPREMGDSEVALRLTIGHEKAPDPAGRLASRATSARLRPLLGRGRGGCRCRQARERGHRSDCPGCRIGVASTGDPGGLPPAVQRHERGGPCGMAGGSPCGGAGHTPRPPRRGWGGKPAAGDRRGGRSGE